MTRLATAAIIAAVVPFVAAQTVTYPPCAQSCVDDLTYIRESGCSAADGACLCSSSTYVDSVSCCMEQSCGSTDLSAALTQAVYVCRTWGVTLTVDYSSSSCPTTTVAHSAPTATATDSGFTGSKSNKKKKGKKTPVGGIAGGVIGGLFILGMIASLILFCLKKRKDSKKAAMSQASRSAPMTGVTTVAVTDKGGAEAQAQGQQPPPLYTPQPQQFTPQPQQQFQPPAQQFTPQPQQQFQPPAQQFTPQPQQQFQPPAQQFTPQPQHQPQPVYAQYGVPPTPQQQPVSPVPHPSVPEIQGQQIQPPPQQYAPNPPVSPPPPAVSPSPVIPPHMVNPATELAAPQAQRPHELQ